MDTLKFRRPRMQTEPEIFEIGADMSTDFDRPLVSVVIPTYNRAPLLLRAVKSVLAQTYRNHEIIVVDDYSDDDMRSMLNVFTPMGCCIRVVRHEQNAGLSASRNTGIWAARGEYVSFLDDDDEYLSSTLNDLVSGMTASPQSDMAYGWVDTVYDSEGGARTPWHRSTLSGANLFTKMLLPSTASAWLIRTSVCREIGGFDASLRFAEDHDFFLRVSKAVDVVAVKKVVLLYHSQHGFRKLTDADQGRPGYACSIYRTAVRKHPDILRRYPSTHALLLRSLARSEIEKRRWGQAAQLLFRSFILAPLPTLKKILTNLTLPVRVIGRRASK